MPRSERRNEEVIIRHMLNDIKSNGICYIKNKTLANKIAQHEDFKITYNPEDSVYKAVYVGNKERVSKI